MFRSNGLVAGAIALSMVSAASADTLTGAYSGTLEQQVALTVSDWNVGPSNNLTTRLFNWDRSDLPAGPGVDTTLPEFFLGYCVEINQSVTAGQPTVYNVLTPAAYGYSANEILLFSRLWGEFIDNVVSPTTSAAFQIAVYEIAYDADGAGLNTDTGNFIVQPTSPGPKAVADAWLATIGAANYTGATAPVAVLQSSTQQDQIVRVPAPASATLGLVALGLVARRRRA